jgi:topoisomerase IV subunit A
MPKPPITLPFESPPHQAVVDAPFGAALSDRYLIYALSTITARSLPDIRDGLKPVHRRLLWAMRLLKLNPASGYKKCARVVGDVIGKYHPHGDQSVYDAMVRLAQSFSLRYPLVDGQGNFGNVDGDNAAAYRYTEARLTQVAIDLMAGLDDGTVTYLATYNGEDEEPEIMPGLFPNVLANGSHGIAVGMATSIPPHNVAELLDAAMLLIDNPLADTAALLKYVQGPDLPTGGVIVDKPETIAEAYSTGRGNLRLRAKWQVEEQARGMWVIVVTEIPYMVQKGKLFSRLAEIVNDKKLPILGDVQDESDENIRLVIEPKSRSVDADMLMESLFRLSDLEVSLSLNLNMLDLNRIPRVMGLKEILTQWLTYQIDVLQRRAKHRLDKIAARLELVEGYIIAYLNLDRVIAIIRYEDEPKPLLITEFLLTDTQAEAILNMRLRSLRKLEEIELVRERDGLNSEKAELQALLASPERQSSQLKHDISTLRTHYTPETALGARRTKFAQAAPIKDIPLDMMIEKEALTVILSERGWIRALKGHVDIKDNEALKFKEGDGLAQIFHAHSTDKLMFACDDGRFFTLGADKLPGGRGFGEPVRLMLDIADAAKILTCFPTTGAGKLLLASSQGKGFVALASELIAETRKGKQVVNLTDMAKLVAVHGIQAGDDSVAVVGDNRKMLIFPLADLPEMTRGQGVLLQRYKGAELTDAISFTAAQGLSWPMGGEQGRTRTQSDITPWQGARASAGKTLPLGFPKDLRFGA